MSFLDTNFHPVPSQSLQLGSAVLTLLPSGTHSLILSVEGTKLADPRLA